MADVFKGLFSTGDWTEASLPMIHCYLFARTVETAEDIVKVRTSFIPIGQRLPSGGAILCSRRRRRAG
jgi:hypothetical protein